MTASPISSALLYERYDERASQILAKLKPIFLQSTPQMVAQLRRAHAQRKAEAFWQAAHTLYSTCASVCAAQLEEMAASLQMYGRTEQWDQIDLLMPAFELEYERVCAYLAR